jgi:TolB-like protein
MRKAVFLAGLIAVVTAAVFSQNAELPRLAVVEFSTNINNEKTKADAITVRNLVESQMVGTRKYQIITRDDIDKLLANQKIQVSSISSVENLKKLQLQNISYIVTGSVDAMGNDYAITVRVLDVSTGQFSHSANDFMGSGSRDRYNGITGLMSKFVAGMSTGEGGIIVQGTGTQKSYRVGDTGPAGGIIFYDKGFISDGWRYLEAAPAGTDFNAQWGAYGKDVGGTGTAVGSGKRNTQIIVERLKALGENNCAAQICVGMDINGYTDWFLPNKDELNLMYTNLKQKGLGGFTTVWDTTKWTQQYWSSSQDGTDGSRYQDFSYGGQGSFVKNYTNSVRAVRAF